MAITEGQALPSAALLKVVTGGVEEVDAATYGKGRRIVLFAVPGAYTPTCHSAHVPSFVRVMDALKAEGVDEVACVAVNDPFVLEAWGRDTGAEAAGIIMLADAESALTKALDLAFSAPARGLIDRSQRYAMLVEDGVVAILHKEEGPGVCEISGGEAMLDAVRRARATEPAE